MTFHVSSTRTSFEGIDVIDRVEGIDRSGERWNAMPTTTAPHRRPSVTTLTPQEREVLYALGCGLEDAEIADALALTHSVVTGQLECILAKLGLRNRAAAIVHAFDCGMVRPGQGPRRQTAAVAVRQRTAPAPGPWLRISMLGPLRVWLAGRPVDVGPARQQAVLATLALSANRSVSRQELLDGVWGLEAPDANVIPVYVYRLRKHLRLGDGPHSVIRRDRHGYGLVRGVAEVDVTCMEKLVTAAGAAERAGDLSEAVRLCARALELFRGEPLAGLPGPLAELERLRLTERRVALSQRKADWLLRLGRDAEAIAELSALALQEPLNEPVAATLMLALQRAGRRAKALAVFDSVARRLTDDLGIAPGEQLRRTRWAILRDDESSAAVRSQAGAQ